jgi:hypothetical protein
MRKPVLRPGFGKDVQGLEKAVAALAVRDVEALVVSGQAAPAHAEFKSSLGEMVDRRDVLGQTQGMAQGQDMDGDADPDAPGTGRQRRGDHQG